MNKNNYTIAKDDEIYELFTPCVRDDGIYMRSSDPRFGYMVITKELFIEAYNKWILGNYAGINFDSFGEDTADDWSED